MRQLHEGGFDSPLGGRVEFSWCKRSNLLRWARGLPVCVPLMLCMLLLYRDDATDNNHNFSSNQADTLAFRFLHTNGSDITRNYIRKNTCTFRMIGIMMPIWRAHRRFHFGGGGAGVAQMLRSYIIYV